MCGIVGMAAWDRRMNTDENQHLAEMMRNAIAHRGPDARGILSSSRAVLGHVRLSIMDPARGAQPMLRMHHGKRYAVVYNGELYNAPALRTRLEADGFSFETTCDTEVLLCAYIAYGERCLEYFNGIYAFAILDEERDCLFLARDRLGVKPLFYAMRDGLFIFASELKGLLAHPAVKPVITRNGLCEVLGVGPGRTPGCAVFDNVSELRPAESMCISAKGMEKSFYWRLEAMPHQENEAETIAHTRSLLIDAVTRQLQSDVPLCTFLSGGLDSSIVTALAASQAREKGASLTTYAFDYADNHQYFQASAFQPDEDAPFALKVMEACGTDHHILTLDSALLPNALEAAMHARDLPGMADVDASLMLFCSIVRKDHPVALCGECADEVFGGYPWFHRSEFFQADTFPWNTDGNARLRALSPALCKQIELEEYVHDRYTALKNATPRLPEEDATEARRREISFLNLYGFMQTLLERKDRMSMANGLEVRVPYCDHELVQYVFNVPWQLKTCGGESKGLLRAAAAGLLPDEVLHRKKSPYPKTHHPVYEQMIQTRMRELLQRRDAPVLNLLDEAYVTGLCEGHADYGRPWFGQLMAGPQLLSWLLQVNSWLVDYRVEIKL